MYREHPNVIPVDEGYSPAPEDVALWRTLQRSLGLEHEVVRLPHGYATFYRQKGGENRAPKNHQGMILRSWPDADENGLPVEIDIWADKLGIWSHSGTSYRHALIHNIPINLPEEERAGILDRLRAVIPEIIEAARMQQILRQVTERDRENAPEDEQEANLRKVRTQITKLLDPLPKDEA